MRQLIAARSRKNHAITTATYLDELATQPTVVLSLQKLVSTATKCVRVRRSSDDTEMDIGFSGNDIDTAALTTFAGAGNAYVTTFYNQIDPTSTYDAKQITNSSQPRIVNAGVYDGALHFDGSDDGMFIYQLPNGSKFLHMYTKVAYRTTDYSGFPMFYEMGADFTSVSGGVASYGSPESSRNQSVQMNSGGGVRRHVYNFSWLNTLTKLSILYNSDNSTNAQINVYQNGTLLTPAVPATGGTGSVVPTANFNIGKRNNTNLSSQIDLFHFVIYAADTAALRGTIESMMV